MSKTRQRKVSSYSSGWRDAIKGLPRRWIRRPNLSDYNRGHRAGVTRPDRPEFSLWGLVKHMIGLGL